MVQANPQPLQPILQEMGKQNPQLLRLIQGYRAETVTAEERAAIERLEGMGFGRAIVLEVCFSCNKNEEVAANYLLDHMQQFMDDQ